MGDHSESNDRMFKKCPRILIIGGGISGIAAADCLARTGLLDFKILEATDRIGGRIWTEKLASCEGKPVNVEMGANWIHGIEQNPVYKLAREKNLLTMRYQCRKLGQKIMFAREDGRSINGKVVEEVDWTYGMLMQQAEEFYQLQIPTPCENDSVGAFLERGFEEKLMKYHGDDRLVRQMIFNQRVHGEAVISGCHSMNEVSLSEIGSYEELPGVHYVIPPGFESVVQLLKDNFTEDKILTNHPVRQIWWKQADKNDEHYNICVECENGDKFYADHVIVTISLGCLQAHSERFFNPPLPTHKMEAINRIQIGTVNKVIMQFDQRIFDPDVFRLELLWDNSNLKYEDIKESWVKKFYSFECIAENILVGWLSGEEAKYMETLSEEEIAKACVNLLQHFLKKPNIPLPKKCIRSRWYSNPYTQGSYSFIPVGATAEDIEALGDPILHNDIPQILFAGEATHTSFYSSSHGALLSGQREAERIIKLYESE